MLPQQGFRRSGHACFIQRHWHVHMGVALQGTAVAAVDDAVRVPLSSRHEPGVKVRRHLPPRVHPNIRRQHGIQHERKLFRRNAATRIKVSGLPQSVNPCVRSAGTGDGNLFPASGSKGFLQHLLHRQPVILPLPAGVVGAVILKGQQNAFHQL